MANLNTTSIRLNVAGGTGTYLYSVVNSESNIPATVTSDGILTVDATDVVSGTYSVKVKVQDSSNTITYTVPVMVAEKGTFTVKTSSVEVSASSLPTTHRAPLVAGGGDSPYTWTLVSSSLQGAAIDGSDLTFPVTSYGSFTAVVKATDKAGRVTQNKTLPVSVLPQKPYKLEDGQVELSLYGGNAVSAGTRNFTAKVRDSRGTELEKTFYFTVTNPLTPFKMREFSFGRPLQRTDQGTITLPMYGLDSADVTIASQSQGPFLGMVGGWDGSTKGVVLTPPPTSFGTKPASLSLALTKSGNTVGRLRRNIGIAAYNSHANWGTSNTVVLPHMFVATPVRINPLKPYPNSADWVKGAWSVRVKSGSSLPGGISLDSNTGLVYGLPTEKTTQKTTLEYYSGTNSYGEVTLNWNIVKNDFLSSLNMPTTVSLNYGVDATFSIGAGNEVVSIVPLSENDPYSGLSPFTGYKIVQEGSVWKLKGTVQDAGELTFGFELTSKTGGKSYIFHNLLSTYQEALVITTTTLPTLRTDQDYTTTLSAFGGAGQPYTWALEEGTLPVGLTLSSAGVLSGRTSSPTYDQSLKFKVTDSIGTTQTATLRLKIVNSIVIETQSIPTVKSTAAYSTQFSATGGSGTYTWSATGLPSGFTLTTSGLLTNPNTSAIGNALDTQIQVSVTDGTLTTGPKAFRLWLNNGFTDIQLVQTDGGTVINSGCSWRGVVKINSSNTVAPYTWKLDNAPSGLVMDASSSSNFMAIVGSTTSAAIGGSRTMTVSVTDGAGSTGSLLLTITSRPSISITSWPSVLPPGRIGIAYNVDLSKYGYTCNPPLTWSLTTGLPAGLILNSTTGVISGTPTGSYNLPIKIQVTDKELAQVNVETAMQVSASTLAVDTTSLPTASVGGSYSTQLSASGGSGPYRWTLATNSNALPSGFTLSSAGVLSASSVSKFNPLTIIVQVTDNAGVQATSGALSLTSASSIKIVPVTTVKDGSDYYLGTLYESGSCDQNPSSFQFSITGLQYSSMPPSRIDTNDPAFWFQRNGDGNWHFGDPASYSLKTNIGRQSGLYYKALSINPSIGGDSTTCSFRLNLGTNGNQWQPWYGYTKIHLVEGKSGKWTYNPSVFPGQTMTGYTQTLPVSKLTSCLFNWDGPVGGTPTPSRSYSGGQITIGASDASLNYNGTAFPSSSPFTLWAIVSDAIGLMDNIVPGVPSWNGSGFSNASSSSITVVPVAKPQVSSIGPNLTNDGTQKTLTVSLASPIGTNVTTKCYLLSDSLTIDMPNSEGTPVLNALGQITGWDFKVTLPSSLSGAVTLRYKLISGPMDYLSGSSVVANGTVEWTASGGTAWATPIQVSTGDKKPLITGITPNTSPSTTTPAPTNVIASQPKAIGVGNVLNISGSISLTVTGWVEQQDIKSVVFNVYDSDGNVALSSTGTGTVTPTSVLLTAGGPAGYGYKFTSTWFFHVGSLGFVGNGKYTWGVTVTDNTGNSDTQRGGTEFRNVSAEAWQGGAWAVVMGSSQDGTQGSYYSGQLYGITNHNNLGTHISEAGFNGYISLTVYPENFAPSEASPFVKAELYGPVDYIDMERNRSALLDTSTYTSDDLLDLNGSLPPATWQAGWGSRPKDIPATGFGFSLTAANYIRQEDPNSGYDAYDNGANPSFTLKFYTDSGAVTQTVQFSIPMGYGRWVGVV